MNYHEADWAVGLDCDSVGVALLLYCSFMNIANSLIICKIDSDRFDVCDYVLVKSR